MTQSSPEQLENRLWRELTGSTFAFVGLFNDPHGDVPMTLFSQADPREGLWIFTKKDNAIASGGTAMARLITKGQDFFARLDGALVAEKDDALIDALWSPGIAAWYPGGRHDPELIVMRFDLAAAELWSGKMSPLAVAKMLLGKSVAPTAQQGHVMLTPPDQTG
ncbi:MAG: pyridoxamine 5'-phosphate oxidase family protein [Chakrabartia sp.]